MIISLVSQSDTAGLTSVCQNTMLKFLETSMKTQDSFNFFF